MKPKISILMPNFNGSKYLNEAIESILNQTYKNFELVILDDCSTDNSMAIIKRLAKLDKRIKFHKNPINLGIVKTRNKLFSLSDKKSKYIAIMDSDDISHEKRLELQVSFLEKNPEFVGVGTDIEYVDANLNFIGNRKYSSSFEKIKKEIIFASPFGQATMMIKKKIINEFGGYNEKFEVAEDYELWFRIISKYKMSNINEFLYKYRQFENQSKSTKLKLTLRNTIKIQLKYIFKKEFFSFKGLINIILELSLLILPNKIILYLFKKIKLKNEKN